MPDQPASTPRRLLVVGDQEGVASSLLSQLPPGLEVRFAASRGEALEALRSAEFDLILAGSTDLLPLAQAERHDRAGSALEGIAQGACLVGAGGEMIWMNQALRAYPPDVVEAVRRACHNFLEQGAAAGASGTRRVWQQTLRVPPDHVLELSVASVLSSFDQAPEAIGLFSDVSDMARMREKLDAIDAAGREILALGMDANQSLDVMERLALLEERLIRYCRDLLHFTHFAVMVLDPRTLRLDFVLTGGFSEEAKSIELYARPEGNGISGYVAATGQSYICPDISADPLYLPGIPHAASSLTVPLRLIDHIVGVLNVESDRPAAFSDQDRQFAEILGRYVAVALHTLRLLAVERSEAAGQVSSDVAAGLMEPLDRIVAEVSRLIDERNSDADLRERLRTVLGQVDRAKQAIRDVSSPPPIRGLLPGQPPRTDPLLDGRRVLVADDEEIIRETIADVLAKAGAIPVTAADGNDAVAILRTQRFDLVLSDIKMPNKSGYDVFAASKAANPDCPVILITGFGYDPDHNIVRASPEGLAGVLFKPFKVEDLLDRIHKALGPRPRA